MPLSNKHIKFLNFGSFYGTVMFIVGFTYEETLKISKRKKYTGWIDALPQIKKVYQESGNVGFASERKLDKVKYYFLVLKKPFDFKDDSHASLAHEVLHLISFNLPYFLDPIIENEAFCYTHTHIMNQCYKILRS